ncbi:acyl-CoA synthetase (NDP forming) [Asanoa ferruginea]|uniref:Acyl-CoA synthetase (NDP forming) n=1 Tax=Asanoa ferruginea TaxID=53367 RepID=A0A3D9ZLN9_9ACTN|nr:acetate--CoA ligase family protein [Asanoa ferruginea]REF98306.1 acyl-CoA synthetase (NDP forming) [Asanoa ferruginea]GIF52044.1 6-carboxyhexanoate--CoA ligase [Asanoa ferruginea]
MTIDLDRLLRPRSIAVVGASQNPTALGTNALATLMSYDYTGDLYPIHPTHAEVKGLRAYPSVRDAPAGIDLVVVAVAAPRVAGVIEDCGAAGVPFAVVLTSGFGEVSGGAALQADLVEVARRSGVRLVGPNSLGFLNQSDGVAAGFGVGMPGRSRPQTGGLAIVSQSGGMGLSILNRATLSGLGVSSFVSTGNEADLTLVDFVEDAIDDPNTKVIVAYAETIRGADRLVEVGRRAARAGKPVIIAKIGATEAGGRAVQSHTGSMAGADLVFDAAFRAAGMVRVHDIEDMFDLATFLLRGRVPAGNRVAVVTQSGGGGAWLADTIERAGMVLAPASEELRAQLKAFVPDFGSVLNPVDLTASGISVEAFASVVKTLSDSGEYDAIVVLMPLLDVSEESIASIAAATTLPILGFSHWLPTPALRPRLGALEVPYVTSPARAARVLAAAARVGEAWRAPEPGPRPEPVPATATPAAAASDAATFELLASAGLPLAPWRQVTSSAEAVTAAQDLGFPVALKLSADGLIHKSDVGGVHLGLSDTDAVGAAWEAVAAVADGMGVPHRAIVQPMAPSGVEVIVGCTLDLIFGPVVMVGAGGIYAEVVRDVALRLAPINETEALAMVRELNIAPLFAGARGKPAADVEALATVVSRLSAAAVAWQDSIAEIDLNPVIVLPHGQGVRLVDAALVARVDNR